MSAAREKRRVHEGASQTQEAEGWGGGGEMSGWTLYEKL